jgi:hypothetical protein
MAASLTNYYSDLLDQLPLGGLDNIRQRRNVVAIGITIDVINGK